MIYSKKSSLYSVFIQLNESRRSAKKWSETSDQRENHPAFPELKIPSIGLLRGVTRDLIYDKEKFVVQVASIEGGQSVDTIIGEHFRRRFRVPCGVHCDLVRKYLDKKIFGENSNKDTDIVQKKKLVLLKLSCCQYFEFWGELGILMTLQLKQL